MIGPGDKGLPLAVLPAIADAQFTDDFAEWIDHCRHVLTIASLDPCLKPLADPGAWRASVRCARKARQVYVAGLGPTSVVSTSEHQTRLHRALTVFEQHAVGPSALQQLVRKEYLIVPLERYVWWFFFFAGAFWSFWGGSCHDHLILL